MNRVRSYRTFSPLHRMDKAFRCGISLLHWSWGHPRRALPVILALWSPDFPHGAPFGISPRLSDLVVKILYSKAGRLSNVLQILSQRSILMM